MKSLTGYNWSDAEGLNSEIIFWIFKKAFSLVATMNLSAAAKLTSFLTFFWICSVLFFPVSTSMATVRSSLTLQLGRS